MNKRIIASILGGCFAVSAVPALAAVPSEAAGTRFEEAVSVLSAFSIMNGDENGLYRLDDTIIRSEVTKMAVTAMGMQDAADNAKGTQNFDDVGTDHWANGYINLAVSLGLVEGDGDGNFRPNDEISYREAVAIMVRAAGYETKAQRLGGYPSGHLSVANDNKMTKSVEGGVNDPISRGDVAILTNNTLETKKMEQTGFGSVPVYEVTDKTLLSDNLETTKLTGQITAVGSAALGGHEAVSDSSVKIDDTIYPAATGLNNLLGYNVTAYAKKTGAGDSEIILALPVKAKNATVDISSDLFVGLTTKNSSNAVEYYADENSSKTTTAVISDEAQIIYNNRSAEFSTDLIDLEGKQAYMTMLDTDSDSKYDIIFITEYKNVVLDYVSSNKAVGKDNTVIRFDNDDYKLYLGSSEAEPEDLQEWDILSVAESADKSYREIYATRNSFEGTVDAVSADGYTIDGKLYKAAVDFTDTITAGTSAEFCLDISGKIAAAKTVSNVSDSYAYLTNAYRSDDRENVIIKITDKSGEAETLTLSSRVKLNGSSVSAASVLEALTSDGSPVKQLVTYSVNSSNKVTELNIANDKSESGAADPDHFTLNRKLEDALYLSSTGKLDDIRISDSTIVFDVSDPENIKVTDKSIFENNQTYSGIVYDMSESFTARVVVLTDTAFKANTSAPAAVVVRMTTGLNSDGEQTDILTALVDGEEVTVYAADDTVLRKGEGIKLETGDVIQYKTNSDGDIAGIRVLLDVSAKDVEFETETENEMKLVYGKVDKRFTDSVNVTVNDGAAANYSIGENVKVYSVDTTASRKNVTEVSFDDITVFDAEENNRLLIRIYDDEVKELVIVK